MPGRLWDGKECLPEALAALCEAAPSKVEGQQGKNSQRHQGIFFVSSKVFLSIAVCNQ